MKERLNDRIELDFPGDFHVMSDEEMMRQYGNTKNRVAVRNDENHIVMSIGWSAPLNIITGLLVSEASFLDGYYKRGVSSLKNFQKVKQITKTVCGKAVNGFAFSYVTDDEKTAQHGAVIAFKTGKHIYIAEYISNSTDTLYCNMAYDMVPGSIRMINTDSCECTPNGYNPETAA